MVIYDKLLQFNTSNNQMFIEFNIFETKTTGDKGYGIEVCFKENLENLLFWVSKSKVIPVMVKLAK